jgi:peptidoglycan/LPS O-acetylase OafA/YrhL
VIVYHAYPFTPGVFITAPPPPSATTEFLQGYISLSLMRWALPFLGLVSGYLFFRTLKPTVAGFSAKLRTRVGTLLVPFLIWSGLGVLFTIAVTHSAFADVSAYWTVHSVGEALDRWLLHPVLYPLWFLQALMMCMVLSPLVYVAVRALRWWILAPAVVWWVSGWQPTAVWPWISSTAFPPFLVGAAFAMLGARAPWGPRAPARLVAAFAAAWLASAALFTLYGHDLGRWTRAGMLPVVVLGICALWTAPDALKRPVRASTSPFAAGRRTKVAAAALFVAPLSFFVYVTQEPALAVFKHLMETTGAGMPVLLAYLAPPLLVITGSVLAGLALRRLLPRTFAVAAGGRVPGAPRSRVPGAPGDRLPGAPAPRGGASGPAPLQAGEPLEVPVAADEHRPGLDG